MGSTGNIRFSISAGQSQFEAEIRNSDIERGAFFDAEGNILLQGKGNADYIQFDSYDMNHNVEQRVWNDEIVNYVHNHPENTIFSPEDLESFEQLENHSIRAILPNGVNYTLIRNQPRTSREWHIDIKTGEVRRSYEVKTIAEAYEKAYSKVFDAPHKEIKNTTSWGSTERAVAMAKLDEKVTKEMETWLSKNARKYGYIFRKD